MKVSDEGAVGSTGQMPGGRDYCAIGLVNPKSPENVGAVMRAAGCYGADEVYYTGQRFELARRFVTDTKQMVEKIPCSGSRSCWTSCPRAAPQCWWI
jgi:tRNA(Leu) C34 or U34 (ribose-2'-O)-methylase TrmL